MFRDARRWTWLALPHIVVARSEFATIGSDNAGALLHVAVTVLLRTWQTYDAYVAQRTGVTAVSALVTTLEECITRRTQESFSTAWATLVRMHAEVLGQCLPGSDLSAHAVGCIATLSLLIHEAHVKCSYIETLLSRLGQADAAFFIDACANMVLDWAMITVRPGNPIPERDQQWLWAARVAERAFYVPAPIVGYIFALFGAPNSQGARFAAALASTNQLAQHACAAA